ncbi:hypothetical protein GCM10023235_56590 [Kitasatospora terrestris]|uniref:Uncharacterized protein n=1 Tax=Kitasatospora terrestris TaxID=258051 RepID=A0ABP9E6C4_9ACTN
MSALPSTASTTIPPTTTTPRVKVDRWLSSQSSTAQTPARTATTATTGAGEAAEGERRQESVTVRAYGRDGPPGGATGS